MFSGYIKDEKPFSGHDSRKKTPKPAPVPKTPMPRKSFFSLTGGPGVIQRLKLNSVEINFDDAAVTEGIRTALMNLAAFKHKIMTMQEFSGGNADAVAAECIRRAIPDLEQDEQNVKDYAAVAARVAKTVIAQQNKAESERARFAYTVGGTPGSFNEDDLRALQADELLEKIRGVQGAPPLDGPEIDMKGLRYRDFYSRSAMREEVTRRLIERKSKAEKGKGRTPTMYKLAFGILKGEAPGLPYAYRDATFHHREPLSSLTDKYKGDRADESSLQRHEWQAGNLVVGPDRNRRVYEPGDAPDVEADFVFGNSPDVVSALSSQPLMTAAGVPRLYTPIRVESPYAAMRSTYLQQFYYDCRLYQQSGDPTRNPKWQDVPKNLIEQVNLMLARFSLIETRHRDQVLLDGLQQFSNAFCRAKEQSEERHDAVNAVIEILLDYGRGEDARNVAGREEDDAVPPFSSIPPSVSPPEEGPLHPVVH